MARVDGFGGRRGQLLTLDVGVAPPLLGTTADGVMVVDLETKQVWSSDATFMFSVFFTIKLAMWFWSSRGLDLVN